MPPYCNPDLFGFAPVEDRSVVAAFDGGAMTSDAGALLLGAADRAVGLIDRFAACFVDHRDGRLIEHELRTLVGQRVFGIALGYEDLIDHDTLRHDPAMAVLAGKSTLNRLELSGSRPGLYHKIGHRPAAVEALFVQLFVAARRTPPGQIVLDLDATDDALHGHQEGRFFHGYYDGYCYLPLYIFCGRHLLAAKLRRSNIDASAGAVDEVARIVGQLRRHWPHVRILLRADAGFAREALMAWCEANGVDYLFGLARNPRLAAVLDGRWRRPGRRPRRRVGRPGATRTFCGRPATAGRAGAAPALAKAGVVGKAEWTGDKANPRFVVTSLRPGEARCRRLYETLYCARGEMENRIKECQLDLFADRTSARTMRANQLRLWFAAMAYVLLCALRRIGLAHTRFARASCRSIRLKLLKIAALMRISVRRIKLAMASGCPCQREFHAAHARLSAAAA